jgi:O-antigen ligase
VSLWPLSGGGDPLVALAVAAGLLSLLGWLIYRLPTVALLVALALLAVRHQVVTGGPSVGYVWGVHHTLLVLALLANALRFGIRTTPNWPVFALLAVLGLNLAFGNLHPKLGPGFMLASLAMLALPFAFTQVVLAPGSRRACALVIALTPLLSVAAGALLAALGYEAGIEGNTDWVYRLAGATGNAAVFATLAFAGFVVAMHEATRPGRRYALWLALANLALVILSGTRMAMVASAVFLGVYAMISAPLRQEVLQRRVYLWGSLVALAATLVVYWPSLQNRLWTPDGEGVPLSGRDDLWSFYWTEFLASPLFGRGIGSGVVAGADWFSSWPLPTPHNEYLHLLVIGGVVGFGLIVAGIVLWYRQLLRVASPNDRDFLLALAPALAVYAITENLLVYVTGLPLYAYLGVLLTAPALLGTPWLASKAPEGPHDDRAGEPDPLRSV